MRHLHLLHQGCAPHTSMANKGGGGGGQRAATAEEKRLWAAQADSLEKMTNIAMPNLTTGMNNLGVMANESMDGTLANRMRGMAGADASAAMGQGLTGAAQHLERYGSTMNPNAMGAQMNNTALQGAAMKSNAMNQANVAAEDMKWNRNAALTGLASGQGAQAINGMGSLSNQLSANRNASNQAAAQSEQGYGMMGAYLLGKAFADGGEVHLANGGSPSYWQLMNASGPRGGNAPRPEATGDGPTLFSLGRYMSEAGVPQGFVYDGGQGALTYDQLVALAQKQKYASGGEVRLANGGGLQMYKPVSMPTSRPWNFSGGTAAAPDGGAMSTVMNAAVPVMGTRMMANGLDKVGISAPKQAIDGLWEAGKQSIKSAFNSGAQKLSDAANGVSPMDAEGANFLKTGIQPMDTAGAEFLKTGAVPEGVAEGTMLTEGTALTEGATAATAATEGAGLMGAMGAAAPWLAGGYLLGSALDLWADGGPVPHEGGLKRKDFRPGGKVSGPGTETSDSIPARLSDGEFVLNAEAVKLVGKDKLESLNNQGLAVRNGKKPVATKGRGLKTAKSQPARKGR